MLTGGATYEQPNKRTMARKHHSAREQPNNPQEMKELLGYMARHHEDLEKSFTDEQKEAFEKFHDCWSEYMRLAETTIFEYAFKLGMQIAIEALIK